MYSVAACLVDLFFCALFSAVLFLPVLANLLPYTFPPSRVHISACPRAYFRSVLSLFLSLALALTRVLVLTLVLSFSLFHTYFSLTLALTRVRSPVLSLSRLILSHTRAHTCECSLSFSRSLVLSCLPASLVQALVYITDSSCLHFAVLAACIR